MAEVAIKQVTMIEEEDETKTTYMSTTPSEKPSRKMYPGQLWRIIGMNVIIFVYYAHVYTRNNNVVLIIIESLIKSTQNIFHRSLINCSYSFTNLFHMEKVHIHQKVKNWNSC